ncbi:MAG: sigma factor-like helix-turn-helix DNA-binding protein [Candidatus Woesearchaeota archaeon]|nr:sigma factor-like helix-turn-helix DNA-binding protein [Candidatus Woesearchaeota archaeon]
MATVLPFLKQGSSELPPHLRKELQALPLLDTMSTETVIALGLQRYADRAFPLYSFSQEPYYFVGSIVAQMIAEDPSKAEHFATEIPLDDLVLQKIGGVKLEETNVRERLHYLKEKGEIEVRNEHVSVSSLDFILERFITTAFDRTPYETPPEAEIVRLPVKKLKKPMPQRAQKLPLEDRQALKEQQYEWGHTVQAYGPDSEEGKEAVKRLVESSVHFVYQVVHQMGIHPRTNKQAWDESVSSGYLGAMSAARKYDPKKGKNFITYAVHWIKAQIYADNIANRRMVKIGTSQVQRKLYYLLPKVGTSRMPELLYEDHEATPEEIAAHFNVSPKSVRGMQQRLADGDASLDSLTADDKNLYSRVASNAPTPEEMITPNAPFANQAIRGVLHVLDEREKYIVDCHLLREEPMTLEAIGDQLGITRERTRQLENRAKEKMRQALVKEYPDLYQK